MAISFKPVGKYAAVLTYNGTGGFALSIAVKSLDNSTHSIDGGGSSVHSQGELIEAQNALLASGFAVQVTQYPDNLLSHAQADALTLAGTL
jgi:hypothetical protein